MPEIHDLYDAYGTKTGETILRGETPPPGRYNLVVHIWIKNNNNELLIQKRAPHLLWAPGMWATTGGSAISGDDSITAIIREVQEELGVALSTANLQLLGRVKRDHSFTDIWKVQTNIKIEDCILEDAVTELQYVTPTQLQQMIAEGTFVNYLDGEHYTKEIWEKILED